MSRIVTISDTHSKHRSIKMPEGDILVCAGDITWRGELEIIADFCNWLKDLPYVHKLITFGNHELGLDQTHSPKRMPAINLIKEAGAIYLENNEIEIDGMIFYGSPISPWFHNWAWNRQRGTEIAAEWAKIPDDVNILITHSPPYGILDRVPNGENVGCQDLLNRIKDLHKLKIHIFGHIHDYGQIIINDIQYINAAICTESYQPNNAPIVIDI